MIFLGPRTFTNYTLLLLQGILLLIIPLSALRSGSDGSLSRRFEGGYGQIEIGGPYVGAEFHHSLPFPSRISFYYPVANSIDLSSDYWHRGEQSHPFTAMLSIDGKSEMIGRAPAPYTWTPYMAVFDLEGEGYTGSVSYQFTETLPLMIMQLEVRNTGPEKRTFSLFLQLEMLLRTSHSFRLLNNAKVKSTEAGDGYLAYFDDVDADSTVIFLQNRGGGPVKWNSGERTETDLPDLPRTLSPKAGFVYEADLEPGDTLSVILLIGSCRVDEIGETAERSRHSWKHHMDEYERRIRGYIDSHGRVSPVDESISHMLNWSKAMLLTNRNYLRGEYVPMPCPAEYNFYFTHDVLLTDLGVVHFDPARVRSDLLFLISLTGRDSVLAHAYYWKDGRYVTEYAGSDNWNHLWFIQLSAAYLKHSGDTETLSMLLPVLEKSMKIVSVNLRDGLMYSVQPDWWDIGETYGARSYLTILTIRALRAYAYIRVRLGVSGDHVRSGLMLAEELQSALNEKLWDGERRYLMNMIDHETFDPHYYSGSLLAAAFDLLDAGRKQELLKTARRELLDPLIGIRNAMPADFHELTEMYGFKEGEVGAPYLYANGGVWSHGTAWYILGLISAGEIDDAYDALTKYMTVDGVAGSPGGQPALYEYRNADEHSILYGRIDKPTFLWAGGWFTHALYRLIGTRDNVWNISFAAGLPSGSPAVGYDVFLHGARTAIIYSGEGKFFKSIRFDGERVFSAVPADPISEISFERGIPEHPYLAGIEAILQDVQYDAIARTMQIRIAAVGGTYVRADFISPTGSMAIRAPGMPETVVAGEEVEKNVFSYSVPVYMSDDTVVFEIEFR